MKKNKELTSYSGLEYNQKWIVDDLAKGKRTPADIDWLRVSNGSVDNLKYIAYALQEKAGNKQAVEMVECALCQSKINSKASECYIERVSALLEYFQKIESRYQQPADSRTDQPAVEPTTGTSTEQQHPDTSADGGTGQPPAFEIPQYLQSDKAQKMLKALEETNGYNDKPVLDRSNTPWGYSSQPDWGFAAKTIVEKLGVTMRWKDWAGLIGKDSKKLQKAYNKSSQSTDSKNKITNALKSIK